MANISGQDFGLSATFGQVLTKGSGATPIQDGLGVGHFYSEGTWTPLFTPSSGSFATMTMDNLGARWTRVGNLITLTALIRTSNVDVTGGTGSLFLSGLPVNPVSDERAAVTIGRATNFTNEPLSGEINPTLMIINLYKRSAIAGDTTTMLVTDLTTGAGTNNQLTINVSYRVA